MPVFYADTSALVKLIRRETGTRELTAFLDHADLVSSELTRTEIPRALRRAAAGDPRLSQEDAFDKVGQLIEAVALCPVDRHLLDAAGALSEPSIRALDSIHIVSAVSVSPIDAFITYDERQGAVARLAGLRTVAPGG